jgi:T5SS/PEP-CTERM-associated repeat protein
MSAGSSWHQDESRLFEELKLAEWPTRVMPTVPGYHDLRQAGRGGQSIVYSAIQRSTKRRVAVKFLLQGSLASTAHRQRFEREVDLIAGLQHPNIVHLYDRGLTEQGQPYYVMEYIEGVALDEYVEERGKLADTVGRESRETRHARSDEGQTGGTASAAGRSWSTNDTLILFAKICDAIGAAHRRGLVHRDIKPSNIRIDREGEPHILDFGLAKSLGGGVADGSSAAVSLTGEFMGTLAWASPEQIDGVPTRIGPRTDVYSLGVVLFQMLTGRFPYEIFGGFGEVADRIRNAEPPRPSALAKGVDGEIDTILLKCLAKEPERRYADAGELARDIRHYLGGEPIEAKADSSFYRLRKRFHRHGMTIGLVVALLAVGVISVFSTLTAWRSGESGQESGDPLESLADSIGQTAHGETYFANELAGLPETAVFPANLAIGHGGATVTHTVEPSQILESEGAICIGYDGDAALEVKGGGRVAARDCAIGDLSGSNGSLTLVGEGSSLSVGLTTWIGHHGEGRLEILDGAEVSDIAARIGTYAGSTGFVTVAGSGSRWIHGGDLDVGYQGTGTLHITRGGRVSSIYGQVARVENSTGFVTIAGSRSTWVNLGSVYVGGEPGICGGRGELRLEPGGRAVVHHTLEVWQQGAVYVHGGALCVDTVDLSAGGWLELADGSIHVNTFHGDLLNEGAILGLAHSPGIINVSGNFEQSGGVLELRLHGSAREQHDRLSVSGTAALGGELHLIRADGYEPDSNDRLVLLSAEHIVDTFEGHSGRVALLGGGSCEVLYTDREVILTDFEAPSPDAPTFADPFPDGPLPRPSLPKGRFPRRLSRNTTGEHDLIFLGPPDNVAMALAGQVVDYDFGDLRIVDGEGPDFNVYECDIGGAEHPSIDVLVSLDGVHFTSLRDSGDWPVRIPGDEAHLRDDLAPSYDLLGSGMSAIRFVRIDGIGDRPVQGSAGFDLDAIGAIHFAPADEASVTPENRSP